MKMAFNYGILFMLATFIFYGGAGVNLANYCCGDCFKADMEAVAFHDCCSTHSHNSKAIAEPDSPLSITGVHDCGIERIEFSWTTERDRTLLSAPHFTAVLFSVSSDFLWTDPGTPLVGLYAQNRPPPIHPPRGYLTLLTQLLI